MHVVVFYQNTYIHTHARKLAIAASVQLRMMPGISFAYFSIKFFLLRCVFWGTHLEM